MDVTQPHISREFKLAKTIEDELNYCSFRYELFNRGVETMHRTTQQSLMRLMVNTIRFMASEKYLYDGRNIHTHNLAIEICKVLDENGVYLPMV